MAREQIRKDEVVFHPRVVLPDIDGRAWGRIAEEKGSK
jgi:hypothetical protein